MPRANWESGLKNFAAGWVRETDTGLTPSNPAWARFSDSLQSITWSPEITVVPIRGLGVLDPTSFSRTTESHGLTLSYYTQQPLNAGALNDGLNRDADNLLGASHSVLIRESRTVDGGVLDGGQSIFTHLVGGWIESVVLDGQVGTGEPILVTLGYQGELGRSYRIDQPKAATVMVSAVSTAAADTGSTKKVTIEGRVGNNLKDTEELTLNGSSKVTGTKAFASISAVYWSGSKDPVGRINITTDETGKASSIIAVIDGTASGEVAKGVPLQGTTGLFPPAALIADPEYWGQDEAAITYGTGAVVETGGLLRSWSLSIANDLRQEPQAGSRRQVIIPQFRTAEFSVETAGPSETHERIERLVKGGALDLKLALDGGGTNKNITLTNAELTAGPVRSYEVGEGIIVVSATYTGKGITVS